MSESGAQVRELAVGNNAPALSYEAIAIALTQQQQLELIKFLADRMAVDSNAEWAELNPKAYARRSLLCLFWWYRYLTRHVYVHPASMLLSKRSKLRNLREQRPKTTAVR
jgi:hypothetical protein